MWPAQRNVRPGRSRPCGVAALPVGLGLDCFSDYTITPLRDLGVLESDEELETFRQML